MLHELISLLKDLHQICDGGPEVSAIVGRESTNFRFSFTRGDKENLHLVIPMSKSEVEYASPKDMLYSLVYRVTKEKQIYLDKEKEHDNAK